MDIFICGDFNVNMLEFHSDARSMSFLNLMSSFAFVPLITKPTRANSVSENHSLLDNIFIRNSRRFVAGIFMSSLSDHYPVFSIFNDMFHVDCTP